MKFPSLTALVTLLGLVAVFKEPTTAIGAAPKAAVVTPRHDPPDMPFRAAPTPAATRSIAIAVSTNLHVGFDTDLCRIHTVWRGRGLNLYGPQYSFAKSPFISTFDGEVLWTMPPVYPWAFSETFTGEMLRLPLNLPAETPLPGIDPNTGLPIPRRVIPSFQYQERIRGAIRFTHDSIGSSSLFHCSESFGSEFLGNVEGLVRRFVIRGLPNEPASYLAHAEEGDIFQIEGQSGALIVRRKSGTMLVVARGAVKWRTEYQNANYPVPRYTESGVEKSNPPDQVRRREARLWIELPKPEGKAAFQFEILTAVFQTEESARAALAAAVASQPLMLLLKNQKTDSAASSPGKEFSPAVMARPSVAGNEFYRAENFPVPKEIELLVTGMDFLSNSNLAVTTWLGDIYVVEGATGPVTQARYRRVARGLLEPMGLLVHRGLFYIAQKSELTLAPQTKDDAELNSYHRLAADWDYSGHYNAFVYGPALLKDGSLAVAIAGHAGRWDFNRMGWVVGARSPHGGSQRGAIASGLREPNGVGTFGRERDLFVTDNQGNWIAACKLNHIQQGRFYGHPSSKPAPESEYGKTTKFDPPAVWFPYKLARSVSGFVEIPDDRFGPFKGQLLVGDFQNALVTRVFLEKVNGEYQGAVWPMLKGFLSGVNRLAFGPDGNLYVGGCQRTWAAVAPLEAALERVSFTGKVPFEIREARARPDGFELAFTQPVDPATAGNVESYDVGQYNYRYTAKYGSPELDHDGRENRSTPITVTKAEVSADRLTVRLRLQGWKTGYVTSVRGTDVKSAKGEGLWNPTFYYTLNQLPK